MALMSDKPFDEPVAIKSAGNNVVVGSARKAAEILLTEWPGDTATARHVAARKACLAVLEGTHKAIVARRAFTAAAEEAGILGTLLVKPEKTTTTTRWRKRR